ncbi:MAG TPA: hypothetical protein VHX39_24780 [Acetobacteraceae bacterium]|nr:hypothetical protein [Acetobacteraceae bacterium]
MSYLTADLGDAKSISEGGRISVANTLAEDSGVQEGMAARAAASLLLQAAVG